MGLPMDKQENLYANYWRKIEETLGTDGYDEVMRDWLTVINAPASIATRDVYLLFKRNIADNGYDAPRQMADLLKGLRVFLARIRVFDISVVNLLLMFFFEGYVNESLLRDDFASVLRIMESCLFRRAVCDVATNSLNEFFSSNIARPRAVQEDGGNIREAYEAILLGEEGAARRMPSDDELERVFRTRDCYAFKRSLYLLTTLENSWHEKVSLDFSGETFTNASALFAAGHHMFLASGPGYRRFDSSEEIRALACCEMGGIASAAD